MNWRKDLGLEASSPQTYCAVNNFRDHDLIQLRPSWRVPSTVIVRVDLNLVQIEKQARWKANAATSPDREMIQEPNILTVGKCLAPCPD